VLLGVRVSHLAWVCPVHGCVLLISVSVRSGCVLPAGLAKLAERTATMCGTPTHVAPEVIASRAGYGAPADMFSAGVVLHELLAGALPWQGIGSTPGAMAGLKSQIQATAAPGFSLEPPAHVTLVRSAVAKQRQLRADSALARAVPAGSAWQVTADAWDLVQRLVCAEDGRLTAAQALAHPWLNGLAESSAGMVAAPSSAAAHHGMMHAATLTAEPWEEPTVPVKLRAAPAALRGRSAGVKAVAAGDAAGSEEPGEDDGTDAASAWRGKGKRGRGGRDERGVRTRGAGSSK
jgi:hypothetical protein